MATSRGAESVAELPAVFFYAHFGIGAMGMLRIGGCLFFLLQQICYYLLLIGCRSCLKQMVLRLSLSCPHFQQDNFSHTSALKGF